MSLPTLECSSTVGKKRAMQLQLHSMAAAALYKDERLACGLSGLSTMFVRHPVGNCENILFRHQPLSVAPEPARCLHT